MRCRIKTLAEIAHNIKSQFVIPEIDMHFIDKVTDQFIIRIFKFNPPGVVVALAKSLNPFDRML